MLDSIMGRRSIRKFTDEKVSMSDIEKLLRCAMLAPSAMDRRPWSFIVVDDKETLEKLSHTHRYTGLLASAPMCVCVFCPSARYTDYYQQDCANATMNILIAAQEMGLGTCWMGISPSEDRMQAVRDILGIPKEDKPFNLIAVGHPAESRGIPDRYDETLIHINKWQRKADK